MTRTQLAWVAGIVEGEGCVQRLVQTANQKKYVYWVLTVSSTDWDVLEQLMRWTRTGAIYKQKVQAKLDGSPRKQTWQWRTYRQAEVRDLLGLLEPLMLSRRRARMAEALAHMKDKVWRKGSRTHKIGVTHETLHNSKGK